MIYYFNQHKVEFISVDEPQKIRGRKRNILFINEANELTYEDFRQLIMRTTGEVILDFNPSDPIHWIYDELMERDDAETFISTYKDNAFLEKEIIDEINLSSTVFTRLKLGAIDPKSIILDGVLAIFYYSKAK